MFNLYFKITYKFIQMKEPESNEQSRNVVALTMEDI
jgi:hypothetical protein